MMTEVICDKIDCVNCRNGYCTLPTIEISYTECTDYCYDDYIDGEDYRTEYFIACANTERKWREKTHGKRLVINGEEFFTRDDDRQAPEDVRLTHGRTGCYAGSVDYVRKNWDKTMESAAKYPDVMTLPLKEEIENDE